MIGRIDVFVGNLRTSGVVCCVVVVVCLVVIRGIIFVVGI